MNQQQSSTHDMTLPVSCGTLIVNARGELLLCHVTGTAKWDIPKGMQDPGETPLEAAVRELREESGLELDSRLFADLGCFDYRPNKKLHLFHVQAPDGLDCLDHLECTSFFPHHKTGEPTPEADGFRWASREDLKKLCWPRMAERLLTMEW
ncbi:NUDIX hydrolase [Massilia cavernae]|uniref:NUDIX hydrolase n=1 Tax=Massilia cavernae TaxID=2320864 RepID=UPI001601E886|nr:NUDIX hydrolase [Massilia cavernae]